MAAVGRLIDLATPYTRRIWDEFDSRFDPRVKEQGRLADLRVEADIDMPEIPEIYLSAFEGRPFMTSMSDRTAAGETIRRINDVELNMPVHLYGGQDYMFDPRNVGQVWASAPTPVQHMMGLGDELKRMTGQDPLFMPWRMAPTGGDFAHMTGETMLSFAQSNMDDATKKALDEAVRNFETVGSMVQGRRVGAGLKANDWPGIDSPDALKKWGELPDPLRKELKNMMDVQFRNRGGLGIGEARLAVSDPTQLMAPAGGLQNVGILMPDRPTILTSGHPSYPTGVPGQGVGRLVDPPLATDLLQTGATRYEDKAGGFVTSDWGLDRGIPETPRATDLRAMQMKPYGGILTEEKLRGLSDMGYEVGNADPRLLAAIAGGGGLAASLLAPEAEAGFAGRLAQDIARLVRAGYPEHTARKIASGDLPMDEASRMARADEQGYLTDAYHATMQDITGEWKPGYSDDLIFTADNAGFSNDWLGKGRHRSRIGAEDEVDAIRKAQQHLRWSLYDFDYLKTLEGPDGRPTEAWLKQSDEWDRAARELAERDVPSEKVYGNVMPLRVREGRQFDPPANYKQALEVLAARNGTTVENLTPDIIEQAKKGNYLMYESDQMVQHLEDLGYDSLRLAEYDGPLSTIATKPKNVRSRYAAFDPENKGKNYVLGSADPRLLAGTGLTTAGILGAMPNFIEAFSEEARKKVIDPWGGTLGILGVLGTQLALSPDLEEKAKQGLAGLWDYGRTGDINTAAETARRPAWEQGLLIGEGIKGDSASSYQGLLGDAAKWSWRLGSLSP